LNYRPNRHRPQYGEQKTAAIGHDHRGASKPVVPAHYEGVEEVLRQEGYHILLASGKRCEQSEISAIETLRAQHVDGLSSCRSRCATQPNI